jgi:hypothetical protein
MLIIVSKIKSSVKLKASIYAGPIAETIRAFPTNVGIGSRLKYI